MTYWSDGDERALFTWLQSIAGVAGVESGNVSSNPSAIATALEDGTEELVAIYKRYGGDLREPESFVDSD